MQDREEYYIITYVFVLFQVITNKAVKQTFITRAMGVTTGEHVVVSRAMGVTTGEHVVVSRAMGVTTGEHVAVSIKTVWHNHDYNNNNNNNNNNQYNIFHNLSRFFRPEELVKGAAIHVKVLTYILLDFVQRKGYRCDDILQELVHFCDSSEYDKHLGKVFAYCMMSLVTRVRDFTDVQPLVQLLWKCGVLQELFLEICFPPRNFTSTDKENSHNQMAWLLHHASWSRVQNGSCDFSLVNTPLRYEESALILAARHRHANVVLLLLRHDANINTPWLSFKNAIEALLLAPNQIELKTEEQENLELCLNYFCRAVTYIDKNRLQNLQKEGYNPLHKGGLTIIPSTRYSEPSTLKHLCRYRIRNILSDNRRYGETRSLPVAINHLPLPVIIKDYVDLIVD